MTNYINSLIGMFRTFQNKDIVQKTAQEFNRFSSLKLSAVSAAMAYYMTMAIFPFIILLVTVLIQLTSHIDLTLPQFKDALTFIPQPVLEVLLPIFREVSEKFQIPAFSIGAISILWAATKGWETFIHTVDEIYQQKSRNIFLKKLLGIIFVLILIVSVVFLLLMVSFGSLILRKLYELDLIPLFYHRFLNLGRILLPIFFILVLLAILYHSMSRRVSKFSYALLAAILPTIAWMVVSLGLSWYIDHFTKFSAIYGSLMGIIILSFWLYLIMQFILMGAFLHSEILLSNQNISKS